MTTTKRPTTYSEINSLCDALRIAGRADLIHYAGACHRDDAAWAVVQAWIEDPTAQQTVRS